MTRRLKQSTILFVYEGAQIQKVHKEHGIGIHIGIWWNMATQVLAFVQPLTHGTTVSSLIDSTLNHVDVWESSDRKRSFPSNAEFFELPRGRVQWDAIRRVGVIYHGNSTPPDVMEELASVYRLPRWEGRLDEDYLTGEGLTAYYGLE